MPLIQVGGWRRGQAGGRYETEPVFAEIDEDDMERVSQYRWSKYKPNHTTYAQSYINGKHMYLHRFIMGLGDYQEDKRIIDHKDGNGLNNKKENLTICDYLHNNQSFRKHHGTKGVGDVYYKTNEKRVKRWRARIIINGVRHIKYFLTEQEGREWIDALVEEHVNV